jgi:integrase
MTIRPAIETFLAALRPLNAPSTIEHYKARLDQFAQFVGERRVNSIEIDRWTECLIHEKKLSPETVSAYRKTVIHFFEFKPAKVREFTIRAAPRERGIFLPGELDRIQAAATGYWSLAIKVARASALRLSDVAMLQWSSVMVAQRGLRIEPRKTKNHGRAAEIPIADSLIEELARVKLETTGPFVLPAMAVKYQYDRHKTLSMEFIRLARSVGVMGKSFHTIRNAVITEWLERGISPAMISTVTGQSVTQVMAYQRTTIESKRKLFCQ